MDFASSHVYAYDNSDEECVSDEELDYGMSASDSEEEDYADCVSDAPPVVANSAAPSSGMVPQGMVPQAVPDTNAGRTKPTGFLTSLFGGSKRGGAAPPQSSSSGYRRKEKAQKKKSHWRNPGASEAPAILPATGRRYRRADTNIVSIKFSQLIKPSDMHTGDAVYCSSCNAVLSQLSKIAQQDEDKVWKCEFCGENNLVDIEDEEIPKNEDTTFMLQPAPCTAASGKTGVDESLVIFCVDTSGSMCVTTEVPGKVRLRGSERLDRLQSLNDTHEDQYLPGQRRNVTYVSRLQGVQAAVDHQLEEMMKESPNRRVALITFSSDVMVVGDGSQEPVTIAGDKLRDQDQLAKIGAELVMPKTVKETRKALGDKVFDLEERGGTALGPALLVAISMACQVPGSKVIICTDGMANVGLGSLEGIDKSEEARSQTETFYTTVSSMAVDKGVSVSVISIKGTDCKMVELGKVADVTGGQVNIVDPLKLTQEFGTILSDPIIATNVKATLITHAGLYIRDENNEADQSQSRVIRTVGNVTKETDITFEFGVKKKEKKQKTGGVNTPEAGTSSGSSSGAVAKDPGTGDQPKELPFQVQITYTDLDGAQALRLITKAKPVTRDRAVAEQQLNLGVLGVHTAQKSAALAMKGQYTQSRLNSHMQQRLVSRWTKDAAPDQRHAYKNFVMNIAPMANMLNEEQKVEKSRSTNQRTYSDDEDDDADEPMDMAVPDAPPAAALNSASAAHFSVGKEKKMKKHSASQVRRLRTAKCDDESAKVMYQMKQAKSSSFL